MEMRRRGGLFGAICHWTLVWLMIGAVAISVAMRLYVAGRWSPPTTTAIYTFTPRSGACANVMATVTDTQTTRAIHLEMKLLDEARMRVTLNVPGAAPTGLVEVIRDGQRSIIKTPVSPDVLKPLYIDSGLDTSLPVHQNELAEIAAFADTAITGFPTALPSSSFSSGAISMTAFGGSPPLWDAVFPIGAVGFALLAIYSWGMYYIISRRRRLMRTADSLEASPTQA